MRLLKNKGQQLLLLVLFLVMGSGLALAQEGSKNNNPEAQIEKMLHQKNYVFKAQRVVAVPAPFGQLTSRYDVVVSGDKVVSDLPYFGRAFSAPIGAGQGGIRFTSTDFEYTVEKHKKRGWNILIRPNDTRDVQQMILSVSKGGYASLQVISNNRQTITYTGYIAQTNNS